MKIIESIENNFLLVHGEYHPDENINLAINTIIDLIDEAFYTYEDDELDDLEDLLYEYMDFSFEEFEEFDVKEKEIVAEMLCFLADESEDDFWALYEELEENGLFDDDEDLDEALKRKVIVRKGKRKVVKRSTRAGFTRRGGKEVRMKPVERRKRARSQKKASRKRRAKMKRAVKKRKRSLKKRTAFGLDKK